MKTLPIEQMDSFLREARDSGVFEMYYVELEPVSGEANCSA